MTTNRTQYCEVFTGCFRPRGVVYVPRYLVDFLEIDTTMIHSLKVFGSQGSILLAALVFMLAGCDLYTPLNTGYRVKARG